jgi:hypothetical protein
MGFRDDFVNGFVMTPSGPRQRTFAQWSLENTVETHIDGEEHARLEKQKAQCQAVLKGF